MVSAVPIRNPPVPGVEPRNHWYETVWPVLVAEADRRKIPAVCGVAVALFMVTVGQELTVIVAVLLSTGEPQPPATRTQYDVVADGLRLPSVALFVPAGVDVLPELPMYH